MSELASVPFLGTRQKFTEYQVRLAAPTEGDWKTLTTPRQKDIQLRLGQQLKHVKAVRAYLTKSGTGSNRAVEANFFTEEIILGGDHIPLCINTQEGADAVWLGHGQAFVDLVNSRMLYLARGKDFCLAGRYTNQSAELIVSVFGKRNIEPSEILVLGFFAGPGKHQDQVTRFTQACARAKIRKFAPRYPIPPDGDWPYATHSNPERTRMHNLGIIVRP